MFGHFNGQNERISRARGEGGGWLLLPSLFVSAEMSVLLGFRKRTGGIKLDDVEAADQDDKPDDYNKKLVEAVKEVGLLYCLVWHL